MSIPFRPTTSMQIFDPIKINPAKQVRIDGINYTVTFENMDELYQRRVTQYASERGGFVDTQTKGAIAEALRIAARQPLYGGPTSELNPQEVADTQQKGFDANTSSGFSDSIIGFAQQFNAAISDFAFTLGSGLNFSLGSVKDEAAANLPSGFNTGNINLALLVLAGFTLWIVTKKV